MRHWAPTAVVAAICGLAAACGAAATTTSPSPLPLTATSSSATLATATPSTSTSPTVDPNSDAAIIAAVHAYATGLTSAGQQAQIGPLLSVADPACSCVQNVRSVVSSLEKNKQHLDATIEPMDIKILRRSASNADVSVVLVNRSYHVLDAQDHVVETAPAASDQTTLSLELKGSAWFVFLAR